jgi:diguanylate cyclase (GGDEF)-like protein
MPKVGKSIVSMLVSLVLAIGLPLTTLITWSIYSEYRGNDAAVQKHAAAITEAIAVRAEITLDQTRGILQEIAMRPEVQAMNNSQCDHFIVDLRKTLQTYANLFVLNTHGEFICSAVNRDTSIDIKTEYPKVYSRMMATDDLELISPIQGNDTQRWVVFAAYPVKDISNKLLGSITVPIDLIELAPVINSDTLPAGSTIRLIDSKGLILSNYPDADVVGKYDSDISIVSNKNRSGSSLVIGMDGLERVYAYTRLHGTDWIVFASLPTEWAFADFHFIGNQLLFALLGVLVIAAILGFIVARIIVRPIHQLQQDAEFLEQGHYDHRSRVEGNNEVGQLAATFNKLSQALEIQEKEHRRSELKIKHLNRVYDMSSQINALVIRVKNLEELFSVACQIAADAGNFRISAIVTVDPDTKQVTSMFSAGEDKDLLTNIKAYLLSPEGMQKSIVSTVIKAKEAIITNNTKTDARIIYGQQYANAGVNSMVIMPLLIAGEAVGAFTLYAKEVDFFQHDEMRLLLGLARDIAFAIDHIEKQKRVNFLAYYDELTGLANRALFLERVATYSHKAKIDGHQLAIGLIDLDRFKSINDSFGRQVGDKLLKEVAQWLTNKVVDNTLLARIQADCFAIILPVVKPDGNLEKLIENTMAAFLEHPFKVASNVFRISVTTGVALFPDDGNDADSLLMNAEAALKTAQKIGAHYLLHTDDMTSKVAGKLAIENRLRNAFDNNEFVLHYQPKVDIASGKIVGAEALIRWDDPQVGLIPPNSFIPILEEIGLINEVGRWAIHKAIEDYLAWRDAGIDIVRIAVNVSPLQLRNRYFCDEIEQAITADSRVADALELEVTESMIMGDVEQSIQILTAIRTMGIPISIDDFGTGFSSLSYLSKLPLDTLKIDRSFVIEMHTQEGRDMVSTIIRFAHALKLKVVAEGVETEKQLRQLAKFDCDQMQGYLFSKAVPTDVFKSLFLSPPSIGR